MRAPRDPIVGLRDELSTLPSAEIVEFERCFIGLMDHAYHVDVWQLAYVIEHEMSEASFFGFRSWLIAQGREAYEDVLEDPERIIELIGARALWVPELPGFRCVSHELYAEREGEVIPGRLLFAAPREPAGEMQALESYLTRYPRLATAYWGTGSMARMFQRARRMHMHHSAEQHRHTKHTRFVFYGLALAMIAGVVFTPWWASLLATPLVLGLAAAAILAISKRARSTALESFFTARRGVGSATHLRGQVNFMVVHAGPRADAPAPKALEAGLALLEQQATDLGIALHFHNLTPIPHALSELALQPDDPGICLPLLRRIRNAVKQDPLVAELAEQHANFFVIALTYKEIRACAYPCTRRGGPGLELCILSHSDDPAVYAHEVLHLFGARDLYREQSWSDLRDDSVQEVMDELSKFIPADVLDQSIMLDEGDQVDPANAFAVGWTETLRPTGTQGLPTQ